MGQNLKQTKSTLLGMGRYGQQPNDTYLVRTLPTRYVLDSINVNTDRKPKKKDFKNRKLPNCM